MEIRLLSSADDLRRYGAWLDGHPHCSLWQSLEWKRHQEALGRQTRLYAAFEQDHIVASALVVIDRTSLGLSTWDIPRGPLWGNEQWTMDNGQFEKFLERIAADAKQDRCMSVYLSPTQELSIVHSPLSLRLSKRHHYPTATRILDLTRTKGDQLKQMKPKGRYNIGVAQKHGVRVEESRDIDAFFALLAETGKRDAFGILPKHHYETLLRELPGSFLLLAFPPSPPGEGAGGEGPLRGRGGRGERAGVRESENVPIAALLGVTWKDAGIYYYGASSSAHRNLMAPYLLQWEAMRYCRSRGCTRYDLLGIAPPDAKEGHPWFGVSAFKEKFGGDVVTYPPEQQIILRPLTQILLNLKRKVA